MAVHFNEPVLNTLTVVDLGCLVITGKATVNRVCDYNRLLASYLHNYLLCAVCKLQFN